MNGLQVVAQFDERVISLVKQIPWGHNQRIINKCKTIENGWSRSVLVHQIESGLYSSKRSI